MSIRRASKSSISDVSRGKGSSLIAGYSPAVVELTLIERAVVGIGGSSAITFSSIPARFNHLKLVGMTKESGTGTGGPNILMSFNGDTTQANYWSHYVNYNGSTFTAGSVNASGYYCLIGNTATSNASYASMFGALETDILEYKSTSKFKVVRSIGSHERNGSGEITINSSVWQSLYSITSLSLSIPSSSFAQGTTIGLYGVL